jgi:hypothetical protein
MSNKARYYIHPGEAFLSHAYKITDREGVYWFPEMEYEVAELICNALNSPSPVEDGLLENPVSDVWSYRKGVLGDDWGNHVITLNGESMAETLNEESAQKICSAINANPTAVPESNRELIEELQKARVRLGGLSSSTPGMRNTLIHSRTYIAEAISALSSSAEGNGVDMDTEMKNIGKVVNP